ncbi:MAG TPA: sodium-transporting two-sector ATPase [Candidatus Saccharimonadales bacterium]|nr:sodium-transporting two-sector ATPase [Candidatus Saccharimonadales bacterium]
MATQTYQQAFDRLTDGGAPVGEVVGANKFLVTVKGLHPVSVLATITFRDGGKGFVREVGRDFVTVLHIDGPRPLIGELAAVERQSLMTNVGDRFIGRIVSPTGTPLDGKGYVEAEASWPVFNQAPKINERELLNEPLVSGVTALDSLFPVVKGQRLAIIGDSMTGKTSLAAQLAINQRDTDNVTIYVLIAKNGDQVDSLLATLGKNDALKNTIVVIATVDDSLVLSYLAPYVACAMGEYLWQVKDRDVTIIYDDLTAHAQAYREISLVAGANPGRDSYPGDIFYIHSSLLERAGKLNRNHRALTALPIVLAAGGDATAYLPTNIISITDGQWILDGQVFREGLRPAINTGLSVTRVGGRGHTNRQKDIADRALRAVAAYKRALEFSHFGSVMSPETAKDLRIGSALKEILNQLPGVSYSLVAQQLMLDVALGLSSDEEVDVAKMKQQVDRLADGVDAGSDDSYESAREQLKLAAMLKGVSS